MAIDLSAEEVASLRAIAGGVAIKVAIPDEHKQKLLKPGLAEAQGDKIGATPQGRSNLRSLRK